MQKWITWSDTYQITQPRNTTQPGCNKVEWRVRRLKGSLSSSLSYIRLYFHFFWSLYLCLCHIMADVSDPKINEGAICKTVIRRLFLTKPQLTRMFGPNLIPTGFS